MSSRWIRAGGSVLATGLAWLALAAAPATAQGAPPAADPWGEGLLQNDTFLLISEPATASLAAGDEAWGGEAGQRSEIQAFEAWRGALLASELGEAVHPSGPGFPEPVLRRTEGVEIAVLRRLAGLSPAERGSWRQRFAALAEGELAAARGSAAALARVERRNPGTRAGSRAALLLADIEFERGHFEGARTWCRRGLSQLFDPGDGPELEAAFRRRLEVLDGLRRPGLPGLGPGPQAWQTADRLEHLARVPLFDRSSAPPSYGGPAPGRGLRSGMAALADGRLAIQAVDRVVLVSPGGEQAETSFDPTELMRSDLGRPPSAAGRWPEAPGWPLLPATDGRDLVLVLGRAREGRANALACVRPGSPGRRNSAPFGLPQLRWALRGDGWLDSSGEVHVHPLLEGLEGSEFQPGPLVLDGRVVVQVRKLEGDLRAWLLALDLKTGEPLWRRFLAKGSDLNSSGARFEVRLSAPAAGQPLAAVGAAVFAGTHLGVGALFDSLDGRLLWSFKNRRRDASGDGWTGEAPQLIRDPDGQPLSLLWAPADSDRLYRLRPGPDLEGAGLQVEPPQNLGEALALVGGDGRQAVVLSRAGAERTVSTWDTQSGARRDAIYFSRKEDFSGRGLFSERRVLICTSAGVYLLDRERELYLLQHLVLSPSEFERGGELLALDDRVFVLGPEALWTLKVAE